MYQLVFSLKRQTGQSGVRIVYVQSNKNSRGLLPPGVRASRTSTAFPARYSRMTPTLAIRCLQVTRTFATR